MKEFRGMCQKLCLLLLGKDPSEDGPFYRKDRYGCVPRCSKYWKTAVWGSKAQLFFEVAVHWSVVVSQMNRTACLPPPEPIQRLNSSEFNRGQFGTHHKLICYRVHWIRRNPDSKLHFNAPFIKKHIRINSHAWDLHASNKFHQPRQHASLSTIVTAMSQLPSSTKVLIVGAGPSGLTTAISLIKHGLSVHDIVIVDSVAQGENTSRATVLHAATMEVSALSIFIRVIPTQN